MLNIFKTPLNKKRIYLPKEIWVRVPHTHALIRNSCRWRFIHIRGHMKYFALATAFGISFTFQFGYLYGEIPLIKVINTIHFRFKYQIRIDFLFQRKIELKSGKNEKFK